MSQTEMNLVDVQGVSFSRGNRLIFDNISLTVPKGKVTAIMGPSGIGKTTLLRLIGGKSRPIVARSGLTVRISRRFPVRGFMRREKNEYAVPVWGLIYRFNGV